MTTVNSGNWCHRRVVHPVIVQNFAERRMQLPLFGEWALLYLLQVARCETLPFSPALIPRI